MDCPVQPLPLQRFRGWPLLCSCTQSGGQRSLTVHAKVALPKAVREMPGGVRYSRKAGSIFLSTVQWRTCEQMSQVSVGTSQWICHLSDLCVREYLVFGDLFLGFRSRIYFCLNCLHDLWQITYPLWALIGSSVNQGNEIWSFSIKLYL